MLHLSILNIVNYVHKCMLYIFHFRLVFLYYYVVHGGWSSWSQGACSKTCGGGIMRFNRTCNNPSPSCGGLPCRGSSVHEESCNEFCCTGKIRRYPWLFE